MRPIIGKEPNRERKGSFVLDGSRIAGQPLPRLAQKTDGNGVQENCEQDADGSGNQGYETVAFYVQSGTGKAPITQKEQRQGEDYPEATKDLSS